LDRGVDGFRLDAVNFLMHDPALRDNPPVLNPVRRSRPFDFQHHVFNKAHPDIPGFLTRIRRLLDAYGGARFTVAEVGGETADADMKLFTQGPERLHSAYGFNYLYADVLSPQLVRDSIAVWPGEPDEGWPSWAFSNHDAPRHVSRWAAGRDPDRAARLSLLLLLCLRGNVFLYQGEELGLPQARIPRELLQDPEAIANWPQTLGRDGARTPMPWTAAQPHGGFSTAAPWLPVPDEHLAMAVDRQEADADSVLNLTRRLLEFRRREPALRLGTVTTLDVAEPLVGFERVLGDRRLVCLFNLGDEIVPVPLPVGRVLESVGGADAERLPPLSGLVAVVRA
jgi:alpha-glucosidase